MFILIIFPQKQQTLFPNPPLGKEFLIISTTVKITNDCSFSIIDFVTRKDHEY